MCQSVAVLLCLLQMCPIGQAQGQVMDLVRAPGQTQRLEIKFDGSICGYLHVRAWRSQDGEGLSPSPLLPSRRGVEGSLLAVSEETTPFTFRAPMDNIVIRTFHFPITLVCVCV